MAMQQPEADSQMKKQLGKLNNLLKPSQQHHYGNCSWLYNTDGLIASQHLPEKSIDMVLMDPPYNIAEHMKSRGSGVHRLRPNHFSTCEWDNLDEATWHENMVSLAKELFRIVKTGGTIIIFMSILKVETIKKIFETAGFYYKTTGVWHKTNPIPRNMNINFLNSTEVWLYFVRGKTTGTFNNNGKALHDFIETSLTPMSEKKHGRHPTQKPIRLMDFFIKTLSNKGDYIFDPFAGSGSTLVSALQQGRNFIGVELHKEYFDLANSRVKEIIEAGQ